MPKAETQPVFTKEVTSLGRDANRIAKDLGLISTLFDGRDRKNRTWDDAQKNIRGNEQSIRERTAEFIKALEQEQPAGFIAKAETEAATVLLSRNSEPEDQDDNGFTPWTLSVTGKTERGKTHSLVVEGCPTYGQQLNLLLVGNDGKKEFYGGFKAQLQMLDHVNKAFNILGAAKASSELDVQPYPAEAPAAA